MNQPRQSSRPSPLDRFVVDPDAAPRAPDAGPIGQHQRLRIFVPNTRTDLTMGYRATREQTRAGWPNYDGFGVTTEGSIVLDAHNASRPENSKIQLQATGKIAVQSEKNSILMSAKEESLFHSGKYAYVHGNQGVVIAGGVTGIEPRLVTKEGEAVPRDFDWIAQELAALSQLKGFWGSVHNFHTCLELAEIIYHCYHHRRTIVPKAAAWHLIHSACEYIGAGWLGQGPPVLGGPKAPLPLQGATYIHGSEYTVMAGGLSTAIYGGLGAQLASMGFTGITGTAVGATAVMDLQLQSFNHATLFGRTELELVSNKHVELCSRSSHVSIKGHHIRIGSEADPKHHQHATEAIQIGAPAVSIGAKEHLQLEADKNLHLKSKDRAGLFAKGHAVVTSPQTWVVGRKTLGLLGRKQATLRSEKYGVWLNNNELKLANVSKMPPPPDEKENWVYEGLAREATELTISNAKQFVEDAWTDWTSKANKIGEKNVSITLKDGNIKLMVQNFRVTIDASKAKLGQALTVKL
jgi:hypothetical protein